MIDALAAPSERFEYNYFKTPKLSNELNFILLLAKEMFYEREENER